MTITTATSGGCAPAVSEGHVTGETADIACTADSNFWKAIEA